MSGQVEAAESEVSEEVALSQSEVVAIFRHESAEALKRAQRWITGVSWFYRLSALAYALVTVFAILALARLEVPERAGVQVVVTTTTMAVLLVMAALRVVFEPLAWNLILATLATAIAVFHGIGPNPLGLALPASAILAALLWGALYPTLRSERLIASHKDEYILHHASIQTRRSLKGRTPEERHERLLGAMHRAGRRAWVISVAAAAAITLASTVGTNVVLSGMRPPLLSAALAQFEAAWNGSDLAAVGAHFDARVRAREIARLRGVIDGHGWSAARPPLLDGAAREEPGRATVDYDAGGVPLAADWILAHQRWSLIHIELPVPPLEPTLALFLDAWKTSDPAAVAAFFSERSQAAMRDAIEDATLNRAWSVFPQIRGTDAGDYSRGEGTVTFALAGGELKTTWLLSPGGTWRLSELKFPRR